MPQHFVWLTEQFVWIEAGVFAVYNMRLGSAATFCIFICQYETILTFCLVCWTICLD